MLILVSCLSLSGCATAELWHSYNHELKRSADKVVTANKLYISNDTKTICISYEALNKTGNKEIKYLIVDSGEVNSNYLISIFKDPLNLKVKSINTTARHHKSIKGMEENFLLIDVLFDIPDEPTKIIDYEDKPYPSLTNMNKTRRRFDNDLLLTVLTKQYLKMYNTTDATRASDYIEPLAWIDKEGQVIMSSDTNFTDDGLKLLVRIDRNHLNRPTKSMILDFDIKKYDAFNSYDTRPRIVADYPSSSANYKYGAGSIRRNGDEPVRAMVVSDNCSELDTKFTLMADTHNTPIKLVFSETVEQYNAAKLSLQILGTPFSVAFDVVTSPVQLLLGILWVNFGHM